MKQIPQKKFNQTPALLIPKIGTLNQKSKQKKFKKLTVREIVRVSWVRLREFESDEIETQNPNCFLERKQKYSDYQWPENRPEYTRPKHIGSGG